LEANFRGIQLICHQLLCIQRMSTESLTKYISISKKEVKLRMLSKGRVPYILKDSAGKLNLFWKIFTFQQLNK